MELLPDVREIVDLLLEGIQKRLSSNLVALYLRGSLVMGDFIPETSDVDLLAVTEHRVTDAEFEQLASMHAQMATLANPYGNRVEIAYIDRAALRRFRPGLRHATLGQGETLAWTEHHTNWIVERWMVREHGVALCGPPPETLIDPITPEELREAVRARIGDWAEWALDVDDPDWWLPLPHKAYVVETMCRVLHTLACGEFSSKPQAVAWALKTLPEPWRSTVARSQTWRTNESVDPSIVPEVRAFVLWVAAYQPDDN